MSDEFEREDILQFQETDFDKRVRSVLTRMLRDPTDLPEEFRGWLPFFIEQSNVQVPKTQVIGFASAEIPTGSIVAYGAPAAPTGWIICDGSAVSRADQALLFAVIGTIYGAGDGSTTFNVPNLRGRAPVGLDSSQTEFDALAETGGAKTHTLTTGELAGHTHGFGSGQTSFPGASGGFSAAVASGTSFNVWQTAGTYNTNTASAGSGNAHNNLQPYLVINYIIKAV